MRCAFDRGSREGSSRPIGLARLDTERQRLQVWSSCDISAGCLAQVARAAPNPRYPLGVSSATTDNFVEWGTVVRYAFRQRPNLCETLEVVDLRADAEGDLPIQQVDLGLMFANLSREELAAAAVPPDAAASLRAYEQVVGHRNEINAGFLRGCMNCATRATSPLLSRQGHAYDAPWRAASDPL